MILKKKLQDGKTIYESISIEEAVEQRAEKSDFVFTDEDEKDKFEDVLEELDDLEEEIEDKKDEENESSDKTALSWDFVKSALKKAEKIAQNGYGVGAYLGNIFLGGDDKKPDKKNKLVQILPFLDDDDIHEIVEDILSDPDKYDGLNLCAIMPFLSENDCDALFLKIALDNDKKYTHSLTSLAPFVSEECLTKLVDKYVEGELQDVDMDGLYPFLSSKDVKRLFKYIVSKNDDK